MLALGMERADSQDSSIDPSYPRFFLSENSRDLLLGETFNVSDTINV